MQTKIYVDGFHVDKVDPAAKDEDILERALTPKVLELLKEEKREVLDIIEVPQGDPNCIFIVTQL
jgi:hypothetical protein